ncbi:MAG: SAM-dependent methyltransferase [Flavobacteriales bacterium]|nr:SAM-dependent methyltransferase [Flavobacteriales bacterium]
MNDDVFGRAFSAFLNGENCAPITVKIDDELQDPLPVEYFFRSVNDMPDLERIALDLAEGKTLDVGAAAGCHSLVLQDRIHTVALEISQKACDVMQHRGVNNIICKDFFDYQADRFDTILFLMNGLGIGKSPKGTVELLKHAKSLLTPDGFILGDSSDISYFKNDEIKKGGEITSLEQEYFGTVEFNLHWRDFHSNFQWIYPDPELLEKCAVEAGLTMSLVAEGPHYDYLLRFDQR